ncbi:MAG TPA: sigma-70 family RNA polymerase sigma factor [Planctomycetota bacterium]|nr:sigma-70 family RNA polymerase sigma factor [Planctomycetota bacterium]
MPAPRPTPHDLLEHLDWVRSLAAKLAFDAGQRADLEQEIWRAALQRRPGTSVPLRAWLWGIAHNLTAMAARGAVRRRRRESAAARTHSAASTADLAEHAELQQRLLAAVNALPEAMRDAVLLRHFEDLPPRAIAARLGVPVATVRTRLQRAQERLREQLDADFGDRRTWALACMALARPRHVVAAAGAGTAALHLTVFAMQTHKLVVAAAAMLLLTGIPATYLLSRPRLPTPPDYGQSTPVASLLERPAAAAPRPAPEAQREAVPDPARDERFVGRVVDRDGAPIAGATVQRWPAWVAESLVDDGRARPTDVRTTTAADGSFSLPGVGSSNRTAWLRAEHTEHEPLCDRVVCRLGEPATIVMLRAHEVPLVVEVHERTTGTPAPRFVVTATTCWRTGDEAPGQMPSRQLRAPDGATGTDGVFRGVARFVEGTPLDVLASCPGYGRGEWNDGTDPVPRRQVTPVPGQPLHLVFEVDFDAAERLAAQVQRGRVLDAATGQPIPGTEVVMTVAKPNPGQASWTRYVQSRADGSFTIAMPRNGSPGPLLVQHPDYEDLTVPTQPTTELVVRLTRRATLRCRIVDGHGQPIAGAPVLFLGPAHDLYERVRTDERGEIFFEKLLADRYRVCLLARAGDPDERAIATGRYAVAAGEHQDVVLEAEPPDAVRVFGTLVGVAPGLVPMFVPHTGTGSWTQSRVHGSGYDAGGLKRGDYVVVFTPADGGQRDLPMALLPRVHVDGFVQVAIDLQAPTGIVRGRVLTQRADRGELRVVAVPDVPAGGLAAELFASAKFARALGVPLGADGSFELPHVADGSFRLEVLNGADVVARREVTVRGLAEVGDWAIDR